MKFEKFKIEILIPFLGLRNFEILILLVVFESQNFSDENETFKLPVEILENSKESMPLNSFNKIFCDIEKLCSNFDAKF